jgi:hypothetical protein
MDTGYAGGQQPGSVQQLASSGNPDSAWPASVSLTVCILCTRYVGKYRLPNTMTMHCIHDLVCKLNTLPPLPPAVCWLGHRMLRLQLALLLELVKDGISDTEAVR